MLLKPGSRIKMEVYLRDPPVVFHSTVKNCDVKTIEIVAPIVNGKRVAVPPNTGVTLVETSPGGLLRLDTSVQDVKTKPQALWVVQTPGIEGIHKIQRRREQRFEVDLHVKWKKTMGTGSYEPTPLHLINVNSMGAMVSLDDNFELGDEIIIDLTPLIHVSGELTDQRIATKCKVVRMIGEGGTLVGVIFETLERMERVHLVDALRRLKSRVV